MFFVVLCHNQIITIMKNIYVLSVGDFDRYYSNLDKAIRSAKGWEEKFYRNVSLEEIHKEMRDYNIALVGSMDDRWNGEFGTNKYGSVNVVIKRKQVN